MDRFIVGSGRCGSTLLSLMLAEHPGILSIFEFFNGLDGARRFAPQPIAGREFAELISGEQPFVTAVLRRGYEVSEITYPFGEGARYRKQDPLPWILVSLLPRLSEDPDSLYEEVCAFAAELPRQRVADHYRALFDWLTTRLGRELWIERSGSSIDYLGDLDSQFPGARFLHLHRDGREVALSMREHHAYRLPISFLYQAPTDAGVPASELGPFDLHAEPTADDPITQILASRPPPEYFGRYWRDQIVHGIVAQKQLDARQIFSVAFEDLIADPRAVLRTICAFFALDPEVDGWIERASARVRGTPPTRFEKLPEADQARLSEACRVGMQLLGRID